MNRVRIAHGARTVELEAGGELPAIVAAAIHAWHQTAPATPEPRPPFGLTTDDQPDIVLNTRLTLLAQIANDQEQP